MRSLKGVRISGFAIALILVLSAHIGSPDTWYSGNAGQYPLLVQVGAPNVVPGIARISIVVTGQGVREVTAGVNKFDATAAAPPPDVAVRDERNPALYTTELWVMSSGSNSVTVTVAGDRGTGSAVIPVVIVATRVLQMDKPMGFALAAVGLFLLAGAITIIASAARESVLDPGVEPDARRRRVSRISAGIATAFISAILFGGWTWWNSEESAYKSALFKPLTATAKTEASADRLAIRMSIAESSWINRHDSAWLAKSGRSTYTPLIPDHGKLMHMFVIGGQDNTAFAHLHPATTDSVTFTSVLPALPPGKYRVFGDIVHESGFNQTLSASFAIPPGTPDNRELSDPDDSWFVQTASEGGRQFPLGDGQILQWETASMARTAGVEAGLRFSVRDSNGTPAGLEPYMGMAGHAVVMRDDGSVFVHLHPSGTISMASQMALQMREPGDSVSGTLSKRMLTAHLAEQSGGAVQGGLISFPYAFPQPGDYMVWVQVKRAGKILTGAFRIMVKA